MKITKQIKKFSYIFIFIACLFGTLFCVNNNLSKLSAEKSTAWDGTSMSTSLLGAGTADNPYQIATGADLKYIANQTSMSPGNVKNKYYMLTSNIDLGGHLWLPIGARLTNTKDDVSVMATSNYFEGTFDGCGYTIKNFKILVAGQGTGKRCYGLFAAVGSGSVTDVGGTVKNLEVTNAQILITENIKNDTSVGIITGIATSNAKIQNCIVRDSCIETSRTLIIETSKLLAVGGISGDAALSITGTTEFNFYLENCFANVNINLDASVNGVSMGAASTNGYQYNVGGIVGRIRSSKIGPMNCFYTGEIQAADAFVGPIYGALRCNGVGTAVSDFPRIYAGLNTKNELVATSDTNYFYKTTINGAKIQSATSYLNSLKEETEFLSYAINGKDLYVFSDDSNKMTHYEGINHGAFTDNLDDFLEIAKEYSSKDVAFIDWKINPENKDCFTFGLITCYIEKITGKSYKLGYSMYDANTQILKWYLGGVQLNESSDTITIDSLSAVKRTLVVEVYEDDVLIATATTTIDPLDIQLILKPQPTTGFLEAYLIGSEAYLVSIESYEWYYFDMEIANETSNILSQPYENEVNGIGDYKVKATLTSGEVLFASYRNGNIIFVDFNEGDNRNLGTKEEPVKSLSTAVGKLDSNGTIDTNIIVLMGNYSKDETTEILDTIVKNWAIPFTLTGKFLDFDYSDQAFISIGSGCYLSNDLKLQYLTIGNASPNAMYVACQGHNFTLGEGIIMDKSVYIPGGNGNYGFVNNSAPYYNFHIIAGWNSVGIAPNDWANYSHETTVTINSGNVGRILGGSRNENTNDANHNILGLETAPYQNHIIINGGYVNLITGGQADGSCYIDSTIDVNGGVVERIIGGNIGYERNVGDYPANSFFGSSTININAGEVQELYGGSLGRVSNVNMSIIGDNYYYGSIKININGGSISKNIYGCGAGGTTGYSLDNLDVYKDYGKSYTTTTEITMTGGVVNANIYGGGYGYTSYLGVRNINSDTGAFYGDSFVTILDGEVNGSIFGASKGTNAYNIAKNSVMAQFHGNSNVSIEGGTIRGSVYGGSEGIKGWSNMATVVGNSSVVIAGGTILGSVYGGGSNALLDGSTSVLIQNGTIQSVFGGGESADVSINAVVLLEGGFVNEAVYGGGDNATIGTKTTVTLNIDKDLQEEEYSIPMIFGGNNKADMDCLSSIELVSGFVGTVFLGGNQGDMTNSQGTSIVLDSKDAFVTTLYGGCNAADVTGNVLINVGESNVGTLYGGNNLSGYVNGNIVINVGYLEHEGKIDTLFGGANEANTAGSITLNLSYGSIQTVYGGNNQTGNIDSNIYININNDIEITNVFGGGNQANASNLDTYLALNQCKGTIKNVFGAGNEAIVGKTYITVNDAEVLNLFGGGNNIADGYVITETNVTLNENAKVQYVYGGCNSKGTVFTTNVIVSGEETDLTIDSIYGGGMGSGTDIRTCANVTIESGNLDANIYGGGNNGYVSGKTNVSITGGNISGDIFGGGNRGKVKNAYVSLTGGKITGKAFAGGNSETVEENAKITVDMALEDNPTVSKVFGGNNQAAMDIVPVLDLVSGYIDEVYFGGNQGAMTSSTGLSITIDSENIHMNTFYGGCNAADVKGDITLTIGRGTIGTLYGGNNQSGEINGKITINLGYLGRGAEILTAVYGGGNQANVSGETILNITDSYAVIPAIYGAGNAASARKTTINVSNVEVGTIFGGGNNILSKSVVEETNVNMLDGAMALRIYGGCNANGTVLVSNISLDDSLGTNTSPTVKSSIFGGGKGINTIVANESNIVLKNGIITNDIYGGGDLGRVGTSTALDSNVAETEKGSTNITLNGGTVFGNVYGGGNGEPGLGNAFQARMGAIIGYTNVTMNDGVVLGGVFGGGNKGGVYGTTNVIFRSGTIEKNIYGGGNKGNVTNSQLSLYGSLNSWAFAGGNSASAENSAKVTLDAISPEKSYNVSKIFGGNNLAPMAISPTINIVKGSVEELYVGGNQGAMTCEEGITLVLDSTDAIIGTVYGGCNQADVVGPVTLTINAGTIDQLFGGNNISGENEEQITINVNGGFINTIYGAGNHADAKVNVIINLNHADGIIGAVYGAGNEAIALSTQINVKNVYVSSIFGGGNNILSEEVIDSTEINILTGAHVENVYGGCNSNGYVRQTSIFINDETARFSASEATISGSVYGAGKGLNTKVTEKTSVTLQGGKIANSLYGGGDLGGVGLGELSKQHNNVSNVIQAGYCEVFINGGIVGGSIFGGGNGIPTNGSNYSVDMGVVIGSTFVNVYAGTIGGDIFGGGNQSRVYYANYNSVMDTNWTCRLNVGASSSTEESGKIQLLRGAIFGGGNRGDENVTSATTYTVLCGDSDGVFVTVNGGKDQAQNVKFSATSGVYGDGNLCQVYGRKIVEINNFGEVVFKEATEFTPNTSYYIYNAAIGEYIHTTTYQYYYKEVTEDIYGTTDEEYYPIFSYSSGISEYYTYDGKKYTLAENVTAASFITKYYVEDSKQLKCFATVQRADEVYLNHSFLRLSGALDKISEVDINLYSINRVNNLYFQNKCSVRIENIVNLLVNMYSDQNLTQEKTKVTVEELTNSIHIGNGKYLELKDSNGEYGFITGSFYLDILDLDVFFTGTGGGYVYANIDSADNLVGTSEYDHFYNIVGIRNKTIKDQFTYWYIPGTNYNYSFSLTGLLENSRPSSYLATFPGNEGLIEGEAWLTFKSMTISGFSNAVLGTNYDIKLSFYNGSTIIGDSIMLSSVDFSGGFVKLLKYDENSYFNPQIMFELYVLDLDELDSGIIKLKLEDNVFIDGAYSTGTNYDILIATNFSRENVSGSVFKDSGYLAYGVNQPGTMTITSDSTITAQFVTQYNPEILGDMAYRAVFLKADYVLYNSGAGKYLEEHTYFPKLTRITFIDWTEENDPSYYYYIVRDDHTNTINLMNFIDMGTIDSHSYLPLTTNHSVLENYVFILDFSGCKDIVPGTPVTTALSVSHMYNYLVQTDGNIISTVLTPSNTYVPDEVNASYYDGNYYIVAREEVINDINCRNYYIKNGDSFVPATSFDENTIYYEIKNNLFVYDNGGYRRVVLGEVFDTYYFGECFIEAVNVTEENYMQHYIYDKETKSFKKATEYLGNGMMYYAIQTYQISDSNELLRRVKTTSYYSIILDGEKVDLVFTGLDTNGNKIFRDIDGNTYFSNEYDIIEDINYRYMYEPSFKFVRGDDTTTVSLVTKDNFIGGPINIQVEIKASQPYENSNYLEHEFGLVLRRLALVSNPTVDDVSNYYYFDGTDYVKAVSFTEDVTYYEPIDFTGGTMVEIDGKQATAFYLDSSFAIASLGKSGKHTIAISNSVVPYGDKEIFACELYNGIRGGYSMNYYVTSGSIEVSRELGNNYGLKVEGLNGDTSFVVSKEKDSLVSLMVSGMIYEYLPYETTPDLSNCYKFNELLGEYEAVTEVEADGNYYYLSNTVYDETESITVTLQKITDVSDNKNPDLMNYSFSILFSSMYVTSISIPGGEAGAYPWEASLAEGVTNGLYRLTFTYHGLVEYVYILVTD